MAAAVYKPSAVKSNSKGTRNYNGYTSTTAKDPCTVRGIYFASPNCWSAGSCIQTTIIQVIWLVYWSSPLKKMNHDVPRSATHAFTVFLSMAIRIDPLSDINFDPPWVDFLCIKAIFKSVAFTSQHINLCMMNYPVNNGDGNIVITKKITPLGKIFVGCDN